MIGGENVMVVRIPIEQARLKSSFVFARGIAGVLAIPSTALAFKGLIFPVLLVGRIYHALVFLGDIPIVYRRTEIVLLLIIVVVLFSTGFYVFPALYSASSSSTFGLGAGSSFACRTRVDMRVEVIVRVSMRGVAVSGRRGDERRGRGEVRAEEELLRARVYGGRRGNKSGSDQLDTLYEPSS
jgi:hypothetical protein